MNKSDRVQMDGHFYLGEKWAMSPFPLQNCYIIGENGEYFRISNDENLLKAVSEEKLRDGDTVSFEVPATKKGKYRWAYSVNKVN